LDKTDLQSESLIVTAGHRYWLSLCGDQPVPDFGSFNPMDIGSLLPNVILVKVSLEPLDFQYRIIGEGILANMHENYTGRWLSQIPHKAPPGALYDNFSRCVSQREPVRSDAPYVGPKKDFLINDGLILPFVEGGADIARLLVLLDFAPKETDPTYGDGPPG